MAMEYTSKVDKQTETIIKTLCEEINLLNDAFNRTERSGSFTKHVLLSTRGDSASRKNRESFSDSRELDFSMDDCSGSDQVEYIDPETSLVESLETIVDESMTDQVEYVEYIDPETALVESLETNLDENMTEDEAIDAIVAAINRMAAKIDKDPKISTLLKKTGSEKQSFNKKKFSKFNSLMLRLLDDVTPGISVNSWSNALFFMIIALKVSELKQYPQTFFKRYVYEKVVPWVNLQPNGWISAKNDEIIGVAVQSAHKNKNIPVNIPVNVSQSPDLVDSSPSSFSSWFTFPSLSNTRMSNK